MNNLFNLSLPTLYWLDYSDRAPVDDPEDMATEVSIKGRVTLVQATPKQLHYLRGDAAFYAEGNVDGAKSIVNSAKRALTTIDAAYATAALNLLRAIPPVKGERRVVERCGDCGALFGRRFIPYGLGHGASYNVCLCHLTQSGRPSKTILEVAP